MIGGKIPHMSGRYVCDRWRQGLRTCLSLITLGSLMEQWCVFSNIIISTLKTGLQQRAACHSPAMQVHLSSVLPACYPHMSIGKVWIYHLLLVLCVCVRLYGYGFLPREYSWRRQTLHGGLCASWAGNLQFQGTLLHQKPKIWRISHSPGSKFHGGKTYRNRVPITFARRLDVGSACVDIRPSPKTDVLVSSLL